MSDGDRTDNVSIANSDNSKIVDIITDGDSKERLAVNALISGGSFAIQEFIPKNDFDEVGVTLNTSTDVELVSVTGSGKIDFLVIAGSTSNYEIALEVDGVEVWRLKMDDLSDLGLSNAVNVSMWVETADKNFRYHPNEGVDFTTGFKILAKATQIPLPTVAHLINYRETL